MPMFVPGLALFVVCIGGLAILGTVFWIWMLVDCVMNKRLSDTNKALWAVLIIFTHLIGALIYFFVGRSPQQNTYQYSSSQPQAPYQGYEAPRGASYQPYQQGYQPSQQPSAPAPPPYQANDMPPAYPERGQVQREQTTQDYEQPQAMYPHDQHEE